jgi:threonyl-tRNA synthetase
MEMISPVPLTSMQRHQRVAYNVIQAVRKVFDAATGYGPVMTEERWLRRMVFLETVAGGCGCIHTCGTRMHTMRRVGG